MRYLTFKPAENKINVYTFSPTLNSGAGVFEVDANSQFVLDYNMQRAAFAPIATRSAAAGSIAAATWSGLVPGVSYDWYVTVGDGLSTVLSPVSTFTTLLQNRAPVADSQSVGVSPNTAKAIVLTASDADNDPLTFTVTANPSHGTLSGTAPNLTYQPASGYLGADSFTFRVSDGSLTSNTATVSITVANQAPIANAQSVTTSENTAKAIVLTGSDPESSPLTFSIVSGPANGTLTGSAPNVTYTPAAGFRGDDSFSFKVNDGGLDSSPAVVSITVNPNTFDLTVEIVGTGTVSSNPAGIDCPGTACTAAFSFGSTVTLTATGVSGTELSGWSGACSGTGACVVSVDAAKSVTATFSANGRDLVVTAVSDPPAAATPGTSFSVTDTVRNEGSVTTGSSTTRYYLSVDLIADASDILMVGTRSVPGLAFLATSTGTIAISIPSATPIGTYRLLACADDRAVVEETNETNNCRSSNAAILVTQPDLVVTAVSNPLAMATPGTRFSITDTTENIGPISAPTSNNRYYFSLDQTLSADDVLSPDSRAVAALAPGATSSGSRTITVPVSTPLNTYYLLSCADGFGGIPELVETNNCKASQTTIIVGWPDIVMTALANPPALAAPAGKFPVSDAVVNQGQITANSTSTAYYLSTDPVKDAADILLSGTRSVPVLAPGASSSGGRDVTVPSTTPLGSYYLIGCGDYSLRVVESDETNNCRVSTTLVQIAQPDLVVVAMLEPPATGVRGSTIAVGDTVQNIGDIEIQSTHTQYYLSLDGVKGPGDVLLTGTRSVPVLGPGATSTGSRTVTIPTSTPVGVYLLLACADDLARRLESDETNNCRASTATIQIAQ
jgi:subtilase family serine protease